jgi:hypothetical protein
MHRFFVTGSPRSQFAARSETGIVLQGTLQLGSSLDGPPTRPRNIPNDKLGEVQWRYNKPV